MLNFPIVDTHLHVWDPEEIHYPWLPDVPVLNRAYLLSDYREATEGIDIGKMVFLQCEADCEQFQREADWVSGLAKEDPRIAGIVAWAPLEKGEGARDALTTLTKDPLVKGIRRIIQFEEDMEFCLKPDFVKGVQLLPEFGLSFDICIAHPHMANTIKMVEQCPDVSFILDHIGKPDIKNQLMDPWKDELKTLAAFPNVMCKMSGLVVEADMENWTAADLKPYVDTVIETFGWDRVMFGGDWPVVVQASTYKRWFETLNELLSGESEENLKKLFSDNAHRFYRL